eukprot:s3102_g10.t1
MRGKRFKAAVQHVFDIKGMAKPVAWWVDMHEEDSETEWDRATQQAKHQAARRRHHKGGTRTHQVTPEQYQADRARYSYKDKPNNCFFYLILKDSGDQRTLFGKLQRQPTWLLENGQRQLQLALQDQGGNQALDAVAGAATAAKAMRSARDRALADNRDWLSEAWLMTVVALLEEGDMLLRELEHLSPPVHSSDVVALSQGAEESTLEMGATQKVRHLLRELGELLPLFERREGDALRGTVPPARAKASAHPAQEPPLGEQEGEEGHQPRTVGEELETAGHDQMTLFVTRKRLHMQYLPDPLDEWIARDIQLSPGNDYVDHTAGETLSTEEREECERYLERFHQRYKLGGKADRLVRIVDRHMPRIAEETESSSCSFRTRWKRCCEGPAGSAERFGQGEGSNKGKQPHRQRTSHQRLDAEQYNDGRLHVSPNAPADDVFGTVLGPGDSFMYDYKLIADHSPGTYWAHPHHHGSNVMQAGAGAASVLVVQDPPGFLSAQLETLPDHSLMLQNLPLPLLTAAAKASGDQLFQSSPQEDLWLVNGAVQPVLTVASTQWHRLRLVMAGVSDWLFLDFGSCETALLAKDGIYIDDFPRWISRVSLPPGGRADLVVRCPGSEEGTNHAVASLASPGNGVKSYVGPLFSIRSVESQEGSKREDLVPWRPRSRPTYLQDLSGDLTSPDCSCKTPLGQGVHTRWIDGHLFEGDKKYLHQWPRDAVVQREISGIDKHSFHQHTWPFQLQDTPAGKDPYFKAGDWHDTYQNVLDSKATVRFSTVHFAGPEVVHCHALAHSDQGMIGAEIVAGRGRDACHCDLLGEAQPVDFVADERSQSLLLVAGLLFMAMSLLVLGMIRQVVRSARSLSDAYSTLPDGPDSA